MKNAKPIDENQLIHDWWNAEAIVDRCAEDVTTNSLMRAAPALKNREVAFYMIAKKSGIFSGQKFIDWIERNQKEWTFKQKASDGLRLKEGDIFLRGSAPLKTLLARERMMLNMFQHLSGIASATAELVSLVKSNWKFAETPPAVLHTRKFLPGLRHWQAEACLHGGGESHRLSLADRILFKDNHKKFLALEKISMPSYYESLKQSGEIDDALIEVETVEEGFEAVQCGVKNLLLDNFGPESMWDFFKQLAPSTEISVELSGNLSADRLPGLLIDRRIRRLSFGSITHSVRGLDLSLELSE